MRRKYSLHQYIDRDTGLIKDEILFYDRIINYIYSSVRENGSVLYRMLTSKYLTGMLAYINYDMPMGKRITGGGSFLKKTGIDTDEFLDPLESLNTSRKFFERRIKYAVCRPMPAGDNVIVSPADSRMLIGSMDETSCLFLKEKFFSFGELLGNRLKWLNRFSNGKYAVFRLTPEKYHYNHVPVSGIVADFYEVDGSYNSCNPGAVTAVDRAYSKNRRTVTIIDSDVTGGTGAGIVAMIEVAALMIGDIEQCYSENGYESPCKITEGMFLKKGSVKSLFRPGSSVDILLFEKGRIMFSDDLVRNSQRIDVQSRFSLHFERPLIETDVKARSGIGHVNIKRKTI
jgi:phosphatidylserine decarboxylase